MSKGMKILLGVSLALNLLFVGLAGGAMWKFKSFMHHDNKAVFIAGKLVKGLPQDRQKVLLSGFDGLKDRLAKVRESHPVSWKTVMAVVAQEPFDSAAVRAALASLHDKRLARKRIIGDSFIKMMGQMTPKEREQVRKGKIFKKMMRGGRHRHRPYDR